MNQVTPSNYEIKVSKTGLKIPVIDGVHLHSIYNPDKEAESFASNYADQIVNNNKILIFGLGFGYHINAIELLARKFHGDDFEILVIEPCEYIYEDCVKLGLVEENERIKVRVGFEVENYYEDLKLVDFLLKKPCVAAHTASFNHHKTFFQSFLTYKPSNTVADLSRRIQDDEVRSFLESFEENFDITELERRSPKTFCSNKNQYFLRMMSEFSELAKEE